MGMIQVDHSLSIREEDFQIEFVQASGPGGQNVNKVATAALLRFDTTTLPEEVRLRLMALAGGRITTEGVLIIQARRYRTQEANRQDAIQRLVELLQHVAQPPRPRRKTRPSLASRRKRLEEKRRRGEIKRTRQHSRTDHQE